MQKKSQMALEFLTTYIWAVMIIAVMAAALVYFGIFDAKNITEERCQFSPEITCMDYVVNQNGLQLRLKNNMPNVAIIEKIVVKVSNNPLDCTINFVGLQWSPQQVMDKPIICDFGSKGVVIGEKQLFDVAITYYTPQNGEAYQKTINGEVSMVVLNSSITFSDIAYCKNADQNTLCEGLDILFGEGYEQMCCSEHGFCCA